MKQVFGGAEIWLGDCLDLLAELPDASVDAVVTDPPYGLSFMGKRWDYDVPSVAIWAECLRVLKPGGHLLAFAGTRTQHRMAVRIEDAGFEIRDMIAWVYGSGFPKSLDVSKAIDKAAGAVREVSQAARVGALPDGVTPFDMRNSSWRERQDIPVTADAAPWQGWGTALKPALEPITVARKPLAGTVAANVLAHGTGALNIDGCRVGLREKPIITNPKKSKNTYGAIDTPGGKLLPDARWPANLIHDGGDEVLAAFPNTPGQLASVGPANGDRWSVNTYGNYGPRPETPPRADTGSAARFFYCPKASKRDREAGNAHPTVKPTDLMAYLCRLVTPPGGLVLDPFAGSGSTGKAALREGFRFLGIERDTDSYFTACDRLAAACS